MRYTTIYRIGILTVDRDNYNNLYCVFAQANGYKHQISKWYIYPKRAINKANKIASRTDEP